MGMQNNSNLILYKNEAGTIKVDVIMHQESVWLSINQMAELFGIDKSGISRHLKNIFETGELLRNSVVAKFATTARDGKTYKVEYYNLDVIISVGYRVNSILGTQFRIWATKKLTEFIKKGFVMDDERLMEPEGGRYFEELLARIRNIRSSEKVFWRKILDIFATSIDYNPNSDISILFFKKIQNKMHWAAHGHTAAELIYNRADSEKINMGITNFPGNILLKRDTEIAKNYLSEEELNVMNRIVTAYLETAEVQALNRKPMTMQDWLERLDMFLTMAGREILENAGQISHDSAIEKAHSEYDKYRQRLINEPTEVERHFIEAEKELKRIKDSK
jgi:hypothetical protein